jgi:hypothetical protein
MTMAARMMKRMAGSGSLFPMASMMSSGLRLDFAGVVGVLILSPWVRPCGG